jgi:hypothetical protein
VVFLLQFLGAQLQRGPPHPDDGRPGQCGKRRDDERRVDVRA